MATLNLTVNVNAAPAPGPDPTPPAPGTNFDSFSEAQMRDYVLGLRTANSDGITTTKTVGVDPLDAGMSVSGRVVEIDTDAAGAGDEDGFLTGWRFPDYSVRIIGGMTTIRGIRHFRIVETTPTLNLSQAALFLENTIKGTSARPFILEDGEIGGFWNYWSGDNQTAMPLNLPDVAHKIGVDFEATQTTRAAGNVVEHVTFRRVNIIGFLADGIKPDGKNIVWEDMAFVNPKTAPVGTTTHTPGDTYNTGWASINDKGRLAIAKRDGVTSAPLAGDSGSDADWYVPGYHSDLAQIRYMDGLTGRRLLFDCRPEANAKSDNNNTLRFNEQSNEEVPIRNIDIRFVYSLRATDNPENQANVILWSPPNIALNTGSTNIFADFYSTARGHNSDLEIIRIESPVELIVDNFADPLTLVDWTLAQSADGATDGNGAYTQFNSYAVTANEFSRDKTIFAGETVYDDWGQAIPLSGSAVGVPDDTKVFARPRNASGNPDPAWGTWEEVGTVTSGAWDGAYPRCLRTGLDWMRFEVKAEGSDQVHTMTTRFGVGIVGLIEAQSEFHRILKQGADFDGDTAYTIGHNDDYFQLTWRGEEGSDETSVVNGGIYTLNDSTSRGAGGGYKTYGMDRMAALAYRNQVMMLTCLDTRSGAPETQPLTNTDSGQSNGTDRQRDLTPVMAANMKADGAILNVVWSDHFKLLNGNNETNNRDAHIEYLHNAFYGEESDGTPLAGVDFDGPFSSVDVLFGQDGNPRGDIEYTWADNAIYPEFRTARSPIHLEGFPWRLNRTSVGSYSPYGVRVIDGLGAGKRSFFVGDFDLLTLHDGAHASWTAFQPNFGQTRNGANNFVGMMMACGVFPITKHAQFDRYKVASDGSYVLFWFSQAPITTIERKLAAQESRSPVNMSKPGYSNVQVAGFLQDGTGDKYTQVEIVAADGVTLADEGAVKVYALPGEDFRTDPLPTYLQRRGGIDFDTGDDRTNETETQDISHYPHLPVYDPGGLGYEAPLVNPPGSRVTTSNGFDGAYGNQIATYATETPAGPAW